VTPVRIAAALALAVIALRGAAGDDRGRQVWVTAEPPIVVFAGDKTEVRLTARPVGLTPTSHDWRQVRDRINPLRTSGSATISGTGATVTVKLSAPGVYQLQVVARNATGPVEANTWVQVWDRRGPLDRGPVPGTRPGVSPPTTVRFMPPPPLPFQHPRVLFSDDDWAEMSGRARTGKVAGWGVKTIRQWVADTFDDPKAPTGRFVTELEKWADGNFTGKGPDPAGLAGDTILSSEARGVFYAMLLDACYLHWLDQDPTVPVAKRSADVRKRGRRLGKITAAAATLHFRTVWDRKANKVLVKEGPLAIRGLDDPGEPSAGPGLCDLALAYDLAYDWMTEAERLAVRDLLVAVGYGRHFSHAGFRGPNADVVNLGHAHNGDFGNMNDQHILVTLAVEGEEGRASADVRAAFCKPAPKKRAGRWMRPAPAGDTSAWPSATIASVENLERQIRWLTDWFVTPWGMAANHVAYLGLSAKHMMPSTLALARRGENLFVTTHLYQLALHPLQVVHPAEAPIRSRIGLGETPLGWWDHHDGPSFGQRGTMPIVWKWMYPDDPLIDYVYRAYLPTLDRDPLVAAMFGLDPAPESSATSQPAMAKAKGIPTTLFDPQRGIVTMRDAWREDGTNLWFDCCGSDAYQGHMHAERNSFDFFALGRSWAVAPGYHCTMSDLQAAVLVKDPRYTSDVASGGYIGESPSSASQRPPLPGNHPTPPGKLLEVTEPRDRTWTLVAGDATACYTFGYRGKRDLDTKLSLKSFLWPGMETLFTQRSPDYAKLFAETLKVSQDDYNPMRFVLRTVLFVRGPRSYVLVVDDCEKDGKPHDWRWSMNGAIGFAPGLDTRFIDAQGRGCYSSTAIAPGATSTEAVLLHSPIDDEKKPGQKGLPRLLVRSLGVGAAKAPTIALESRPPDGPGPFLTYGYDNNRAEKVAVDVPTNRLLIDRPAAVRPEFMILLFPFRTGEPLPTTSWNADRSRLTVSPADGLVDTIAFDRAKPDHRTRLTFTRERKPAP
jgi:hypothetical protein